MDFTATNIENLIPSRSTLSPSDHQKEYRDGQTLRFEIQPFNAFIDPRQSYLRFKVKVENAPSLVCFSKKAGIHSLISQIRIYDMEHNHQLETIQSYSELAQKLHLYSENRTIRNKRGLTELLEYGSRDFDGELYDNQPDKNTDQSQLFTHQYLTGNEASYTANTDYTTNPNECEVAFRIYSGILGNPSTKMYPAFLTKGLRVEIDLNSASKALELWTGAGILNDDGTIATDIEGSSRFGVATPTPTTANPLTSVDLYCDLNAGYNQVRAGTNPPTQVSIDEGVKPVANQLVGAVNLKVGEQLWGFNNANPPVFKFMGNITSVDCNAGENAGGAVRVRVVLDGTGADGSEFVGGTGRNNLGTPQATANNTCGIKRTNIFPAGSPPKVVINDVEFVLKTAQPPQSYIDSLIKQTQTEEGAILDYLTWDVYRNNIQSAEQLAQINIPAINRRATAIMCLPMENSTAPEVYTKANDTIIDGCDNYNFIVNQKLQPTRKVNLKLLSQTPAKTAQVACWENEKALGASKLMVSNLDYQDTNFFISRALAMYGNVYDLQKDGNISLKVEYTAPSKNKLMISYIAGLRRIRVNREGLTIET
jgi:hypothetical protein